MRSRVVCIATQATAVLITVLLLQSFALPRAAQAKGVGGVDFPATVQADGKTLTMNGAGVRTRFFFQVYAIGLYLETPSTNASSILGSDTMRRATLHMLRAVPASDMAEAIGEAFNANAGENAAKLKSRLDDFKRMFPSAEAGEVITLTYVPGTGTEVAANDKKLGTIPGKDFADTLFSSWIGIAPVDESLKAALLAGK